ncbi:MAG: hypothetical protein AB7S75_08775 [Desulfococcaceae bacterium]
MSHKLILELSDDIFSAIHYQAAKTGVSPVNLIRDSLEKQFCLAAVLQSLKSEMGKNSARGKIESHFGAVDLGYPTGADNEGICGNPEGCQRIARHFNAGIE